MNWHSLPPVLFYAPIVPHVIWLCMKYNTSPALIMSANPVFEFGGLPFSSKFSMHTNFAKVLPMAKLNVADSLEKRLTISKEFSEKYTYPLIAKPDTGHRGVGVKKVNTETELKDVLNEQSWDLVLQEYCDLDLEYGVFYYREPGEAQGRIISLTKKVIPKGLDLVTASHCRGAIFTNAESLGTQELTNDLNFHLSDKDFYFGRLDVKAESDEALMRGDYKIIEINGATSEFIHIYDETSSWSYARKELRRQWSLLFKIAKLSQNKHGIKTTFYEFCRLYLEFFKKTRAAEGVLW
ncbi:MAG: hypothetical protein ACI93R_002894 [Flavobacteriales bacterium]|jgi:hypothetical protein